MMVGSCLEEYESLDEAIDPRIEFVQRRQFFESSTSSELYKTLYELLFGVPKDLSKNLQDWERGLKSIL